MHHELLVAAEEELEARQVGVLIVGQLLVMKKLGHQGLHLRVMKGERPLSRRLAAGRSPQELSLVQP